MKSVIKLRYLIVFIFCALFNICSVAALNIKIDNIGIVDTGGEINVEDITFENGNITSGIEFNELNDYVTFSIDVKNNEKDKYIIDSIKDNNSNENISIEYDIKDKNLPSNGKQTILVTLKYSKKLINVENIKLDNLNFNLSLSRSSVLNPTTGDNIIKFIIIFIIAIIVLILALILLKKRKSKEKKIVKSIIFLLLVLAPMTIYAKDKVNLNIKFANITINGEMLPYSIIINNADGTSTEIIRRYGEKLGQIEPQSKNGYIFVKYVDQNDNEVNSDTIVTNSFMIKPVFEVLEYNIVYDLDGGQLENSNPSKYTVEEQFELNNPNKKGYTFAGWTGSNGEGLQTRVTINKGTTGKLIFKANYSANTNTKYKVIHKYQNMDNTYEEVVENLNGATDTTVTPALLEREGFKNPELQSIKISIDEDSEVTYIYLREKYTLNVTNRTYIDNISTENGEYYYDTEITLKALSRKGYTFKWSDGSIDLEKKFNIKKNTTIYPIYTPKEDTKYTIIHKQMDIKGKTYVEYERQVLSGKTDSEVTPSVKEYDGFTSPNTQTVTINGDESTVVEYLYTRNKYTLNVTDRTYLVGESSVNDEYYYDTEIKLSAKERDGYSFMWSDDTTNLTKVFNIKNNIEITPIYTPNTNTKYKVVHKLMNKDGKGYAEIETENLYGTTDSSITPSVKEYEGFTSPNTKTTTINGDESTIVEYLYIRNQYDLIVEDNQFVIEDKSGKYYYDTEVELSAKDRNGYDFVGWSNGSLDKTTSVKILNNTAIKPVYKAKDDTPYKVIHYTMNIDGNGYTEKEEQLLTGKTDTEVTPEVKDYEGFTSPSTKTITISADEIKIVKYYYERNKFSFSTEDKDYIITNYSDDNYYYDTEITVKAKNREGYTFVKWNDGNTSVEYKFNLKNNKILKPIYEAKKYNIIYNANDGTGRISSEEFTYDIETELKENEFVRNGYTFVKWNTKADGTGKDYTDEERVINLVTEGNITLYAIWSANDNTKYTVIHKTMNLDGITYKEELVESLEGTTDTEVTPKVKKYTGFKSPETQTIVINGDGTSQVIYEYERNKYILTLEDSKYIETTTPSGEYYYDTQISLTAKTRDNYIFEKWSNDITTSQYTFKITSDVTLKPIYFKNNFVVIFDTNSETEIENMVVPNGSSIETLPIPTKYLYDFDGWYTKQEGGEKVNDGYTPINDVMLYAHWSLSPFPLVFTQQEACTFNGAGNNITGDECSKYHDKEYIDTNIALYSENNYNKDYEIGFDINTFDLNSQVKQSTLMNTKNELGNNISAGLVFRFYESSSQFELSQYINSTQAKVLGNSDEISKVAIVRKNGNYYYSFNDDFYKLMQENIEPQDIHNAITWFGASKNSAGEPIRQFKGTLSNMYIRLGTYESDDYTITFDANGGTVSETSRTRKGLETLGDLPTPTKDNAKFVGWYTKPAGGNKVEKSVLIRKSVTLYAHWTSTGSIVEVNGTYYADLNKALNAVPTDGTETTITLLDDIDTYSTISLDKNIVINTDGHTIINSNNSYIFEVSGKLTITNGNIISNAQSASAINVTSTGELYLNGGSIEATGTKQAIYNNGGKVVLDGGVNLINESSNRATIQVLGNGTLNIEDATIISNNYSALRIDKGIVNIGTNDNDINTTTPILQGKIYAVSTADNFNMYNGKLLGRTDVVDNISKLKTESSVQIVTDTEVDGRFEYKNLYLKNND